MVQLFNDDYERQSLARELTTLCDDAHHFTVEATYKPRVVPLTRPNPKFELGDRDRLTAVIRGHQPHPLSHSPMVVVSPPLKHHAHPRPADDDEGQRQQ